MMLRLGLIGIFIIAAVIGIAIYTRHSGDDKLVEINRGHQDYQSLKPLPVSQVAAEIEQYCRQALKMNDELRAAVNLAKLNGDTKQWKSKEAALDDLYAHLPDPPATCVEVHKKLAGIQALISAAMLNYSLGVQGASLMTNAQQLREKMKSTTDARDASLDKYKDDIKRLDIAIRTLGKL
jgi:hypothetical protein